MAELPQEFRDEIADALTDGYCGGASGRGWTFMGDPIPKEDVRAGLVQNPDKMRHIARMESAVWAVIERWCEPDSLASRDSLAPTASSAAQTARNPKEGDHA